MHNHQWGHIRCLIKLKDIMLVKLRSTRFGRDSNPSSDLAGSLKLIDDSGMRYKLRSLGTGIERESDE